MRRRDFLTMSLPSMAVMVGLLALPILFTIVWSFQRVEYAGGGQWVGLTNYRSALGDAEFRHAAAFTTAFAVAQTLLIVVLGYGLALLMNRARRGRSVFLGLLLVPYVIPAVIASTAFGWLFDDNFGGLVNVVSDRLFGMTFEWFASTWPNRVMILLDVVWISVPFAMIVFLAAMKGVPDELVEAAMVDGASWWRRQLHVVIPHSWPMITFVALISTMDGLRSLRSTHPALAGGERDRQPLGVALRFPARLRTGEPGPGSRQRGQRIDDHRHGDAHHSPAAEHLERGEVTMKRRPRGQAVAVTAALILITLLAMATGDLDRDGGHQAFDAFSRLWLATNFARYVTNTLLVALVSVAATLLIATPAAYALSRVSGKVAAVILGFALLLRASPAFATVLPFYNFAVKFGMYDTIPGLAIAFVAVDQPFTIWLLRGFFVNIPKELDEAALMDGCSRWGAFRRVVLPVCLPGLVTAAILTFLIAFQYILPVVLTDVNSKTVPVFLASQIGQTLPLLQQAAAGVTLVTLPIIASAFVVQRYLIAGLTSGSVKG